MDYTYAWSIPKAQTLRDARVLNGFAQHAAYALGAVTCFTHKPFEWTLYADVRHSNHPVDIHTTVPGIPAPFTCQRLSSNHIVVTWDPHAVESWAQAASSVTPVEGNKVQWGLLTLTDEWVHPLQSTIQQLEHVHTMFQQLHATPASETSEQHQLQQDAHQTLENLLRAATETALHDHTDSVRCFTWVGGRPTTLFSPSRLVQGHLLQYGVTWTVPVEENEDIQSHVPDAVVVTPSASSPSSTRHALFSHASRPQIHVNAVKEVVPTEPPAWQVRIEVRWTGVSPVTWSHTELRWQESQGSPAFTWSFGEVPQLHNQDVLNSVPAPHDQWRHIHANNQHAVDLVRAALSSHLDTVQPLTERTEGVEIQTDIYVNTYDPHAARQLLLQIPQPNVRTGWRFVQLEDTFVCLNRPVLLGSGATTTLTTRPNVGVHHTPWTRHEAQPTKTVCVMPAFVDAAHETVQGDRGACSPEEQGACATALADEAANEEHMDWWVVAELHVAFGWSPHHVQLFHDADTEEDAVLVPVRVPPIPSSVGERWWLVVPTHLRHRAHPTFHARIEAFVNTARHSSGLETAGWYGAMTNDTLRFDFHFLPPLTIHAVPITSHVLLHPNVLRDDVVAHVVDCSAHREPESAATTNQETTQFPVQQWSWSWKLDNAAPHVLDASSIVFHDARLLHQWEEEEGMDTDTNTNTNTSSTTTGRVSVQVHVQTPNVTHGESISTQAVVRVFQHTVPVQRVEPDNASKPTFCIIRGLSDALVHASEDVIHSQPWYSAHDKDRPYAMWRQVTEDQEDHTPSETQRLVLQPDVRHAHTTSCPSWWTGRHIYASITIGYPHDVRPQAKLYNACHHLPRRLHLQYEWRHNEPIQAVDAPHLFTIWWPLLLCGKHLYDRALFLPAPDHDAQFVVFIPSNQTWTPSAPTTEPFWPARLAHVPPSYRVLVCPPSVGCTCCSPTTSETTPSTLQLPPSTACAESWCIAIAKALRATIAQYHGSSHLDVRTSASRTRLLPDPTDPQQQQQQQQEEKQDLDVPVAHVHTWARNALVVDQDTNNNNMHLVQDALRFSDDQPPSRQTMAQPVDELLLMVCGDVVRRIRSPCLLSYASVLSLYRMQSWWLRPPHIVFPLEVRSTFVRMLVAPDEEVFSTEQHPAMSHDTRIVAQTLQPQWRHDNGPQEWVVTWSAVDASSSRWLDTVVEGSSGWEIVPHEPHGGDNDALSVLQQVEVVVQHDPDHPFAIVAEHGATWGVTPSPLQRIEWKWTYVHTPLPPTITPAAPFHFALQEQSAEIMHVSAWLETLNLSTTWQPCILAPTEHVSTAMPNVTEFKDAQQQTLAWIFVGRHTWAWCLPAGVDGSMGLPTNRPLQPEDVFQQCAFSHVRVHPSYVAVHAEPDRLRSLHNMLQASQLRRLLLIKTVANKCVWLSMQQEDNEKEEEEEERSSSGGACPRADHTVWLPSNIDHMSDEDLWDSVSNQMHSTPTPTDCSAAHDEQEGMSHHHHWTAQAPWRIGRWASQNTLAWVKASPLYWSGSVWMHFPIMPSHRVHVQSVVVQPHVPRVFSMSPLPLARARASDVDRVGWDPDSRRLLIRPSTPEDLVWLSSINVHVYGQVAGHTVSTNEAAHRMVIQQSTAEPMRRWDVFVDARSGDEEGAWPVEWTWNPSQNVLVNSPPHSTTIACPPVFAHLHCTCPIRIVRAGGLPTDPPLRWSSSYDNLEWFVHMDQPLVHVKDVFPPGGLTVQMTLPSNQTVAASTPPFSHLHSLWEGFVYFRHWLTRYMNVHAFGMHAPAAMDFKLAPTPRFQRVTDSRHWPEHLFLRNNDEPVAQPPTWVFLAFDVASIVPEAWKVQWTVRNDDLSENTFVVEWRRGEHDDAAHVYTSDGLLLVTIAVRTDDATDARYVLVYWNNNNNNNTDQVATSFIGIDIDVELASWFTGEGVWHRVNADSLALLGSPSVDHEGEHGDSLCVQWNASWVQETVWEWTNKTPQSVLDEEENTSDVDVSMEEDDMPYTRVAAIQFPPANALHPNCALTTAHARRKELPACSTSPFDGPVFACQWHGEGWWEYSAHDTETGVVWSTVRTDLASPDFRVVGATEEEEGNGHDTPVNPCTWAHGRPVLRGTSPEEGWLYVYYCPFPPISSSLSTWVYSWVDASQHRQAITVSMNASDPTDTWSKAWRRAWDAHMPTGWTLCPTTQPSSLHSNATTTMRWKPRCPLLSRHAHHARTTGLASWPHFGMLRAPHRNSILTWTTPPLPTTLHEADEEPCVYDAYMRWRPWSMGATPTVRKVCSKIEHDNGEVKEKNHRFAHDSRGRTHVHGTSSSLCLHVEPTLHGTHDALLRTRVCCSPGVGSTALAANECVAEMEEADHEAKTMVSIMNVSELYVKCACYGVPDSVLAAVVQSGQHRAWGSCAHVAGPWSCRVSQPQFQRQGTTWSTTFRLAPHWLWLPFSRDPHMQRSIVPQPVTLQLSERHWESLMATATLARQYNPSRTNDVNDGCDDEGLQASRSCSSVSLTAEHGPSSSKMVLWTARHGLQGGVPDDVTLCRYDQPGAWVSTLPIVRSTFWSDVLPPHAEAHIDDDGAGLLSLHVLKRLWFTREGNDLWESKWWRVQDYTRTVETVSDRPFCVENTRAMWARVHACTDEEEGTRTRTVLPSGSRTWFSEQDTSPFTENVHALTFPASVDENAQVQRSAAHNTWTVTLPARWFHTRTDVHIQCGDTTLTWETPIDWSCVRKTVRCQLLHLPVLDRTENGVAVDEDPSHVWVPVGGQGGTEETEPDWLRTHELQSEFRVWRGAPVSRDQQHVVHITCRNMAAWINHWHARGVRLRWINERTQEECAWDAQSGIVVVNANDASSPWIRLRVDMGEPDATRVVLPVADQMGAHEELPPPSSFNSVWRVAARLACWMPLGMPCPPTSLNDLEVFFQREDGSRLTVTNAGAPQVHRSTSIVACTDSCVTYAWSGDNIRIARIHASRSGTGCGGTGRHIKTTVQPFAFAPIWMRVWCCRDKDKHVVEGARHARWRRGWRTPHEWLAYARSADASMVATECTVWFGRRSVFWHHSQSQAVWDAQHAAFRSDNTGRAPWAFCLSHLPKCVNIAWYVVFTTDPQNWWAPAVSCGALVDASRFASAALPSRGSTSCASMAHSCTRPPGSGFVQSALQHNRWQGFPDDVAMSLLSSDGQCQCLSRQCDAMHRTHWTQWLPMLQQACAPVGSIGAANAWSIPRVEPNMFGQPGRRHMLRKGRSMTCRREVSLVLVEARTLPVPSDLTWLASKNKCTVSIVPWVRVWGSVDESVWQFSWSECVEFAHRACKDMLTSRDVSEEERHRLFTCECVWTWRTCDNEVRSCSVSLPLHTLRCAEDMEARFAHTPLRVHVDAWPERLTVSTRCFSRTKWVNTACSCSHWRSGLWWEQGPRGLHRQLRVPSTRITVHSPSSSSSLPCENATPLHAVSPVVELVLFVQDRHGAWRKVVWPLSLLLDQEGVEEGNPSLWMRMDVCAWVRRLRAVGPCWNGYAKHVWDNPVAWQEWAQLRSIPLPSSSHHMGLVMCDTRL